MASLYIDRPGLSLVAEGAVLVIEGPDQAVKKIPLRLLERVVIESNVTISATLLRRLASWRIPVILINSRQPEASPALHGLPGLDVSRRLAQYHCAQDPEFRFRVASRLVLQKLKRQRQLLLLASADRPDKAAELVAAAQRISRLEQQARELVAPALEELRGLEGAAAAQYFAAYALLFPASVEFTHRNRRPPRDPVNACLSLGYTLAHAETTAAILGCGLDPYAGFYHEALHGRESLATDLLEPARPLIDRWVWDLFRHRILRPQHFSRTAQRCLLGKTGRKAFYQAYTPLASQLRRRQRRICRWLIGLIDRATQRREVSPDEETTLP